MPTRTDNLTEIAKPIADRLTAHCGSLKRILSAGVMALDACSAEEREMYMAAAIGAHYESPEDARIKKSMLLLKEVLDKSSPGDIIRVLTYEESAALRTIVAALPARPAEEGDIKRKKKGA